MEFDEDNGSQAKPIVPTVVGDEAPSQVIRTMGIGHILPQETPQVQVIEEGSKATLEETPQGKSSSPPQEQDVSGAQAPIQEQDEVPQHPEQDQGKAQPNGMSPSLRPKIKLKEVVKIKNKRLSLRKQRENKFDPHHEEFNQVKKNLKRRDNKRH